MKKIVIGILAHVDAGKTTLTESMLYHSGSIRSLGRVDHKDAFLDYDNQERDRGITIFSKEARFQHNDTEIIMLDTPGHVDFSSEMERTLQVLDYAIMIINGMDGVQSHSETIWNLLKIYDIPTFIFVNKMDAAHFSKEELLEEIETKLSKNCVDFEANDKEERIAMCDDELLDEYVLEGSLSIKQIQECIFTRKCFPVFFGSALKNKQINEFMDAFCLYSKEREYPNEFGARIYKVSKDKQGNRLTHIKVTGGSLKVKSMIDEEKIDQIRLYNGLKFELCNEAYAGEIVALKGIKNLLSGEGIGYEKENVLPILKPYMKYRIQYEDIDSIQMLGYLKELKDEDPTLNVQYVANKDEIYVQLMGEIQVEIIKNILLERFQVNATFDEGDVVYKETIEETIEGIGHFEPLRHYAEVHVLLEPLPEGSGMQFEVKCKEDELAKNWQRLIYTHFIEKEHIGVLTGSPITDIKISLIGGKAHLKHTMGGDFRQATYRAIRQGLKCAKSVVLEPYFQYRLLIPSEVLSKAIYDIQQMEATFEMEDQGDFTLLKGEAPVRMMQNYNVEVMNYSKGRGKLYFQLSTYKKVKNQEDIIRRIGYDSELDVDNPTGSVFCRQGAGFYVPYDEVISYAHLGKIYVEQALPVKVQSVTSNKYRVDDDEVKRVFESIYGKSKPKNRDPKKKREKVVYHSKPVEHKPLCMLIDGYNVIHGWDELKELAESNLDAARERLIDILSSYQGYKKCLLILVFDAYKVDQGIGSDIYNGSIHIVYTRQAQTADSYIEKASHDLSSKYNVTVVTSDGMEQLIIIGQGAYRMSTRELKNQIDMYNKRRLDDQKKEFNGLSRPLEKIKEYEE